MGRKGICNKLTYFRIQCNCEERTSVINNMHMKQHCNIRYESLKMSSQTSERCNMGNREYIQSSARQHYGFAFECIDISSIQNSQ
jgi:hypothetical protein